MGNVLLGSAAPEITLARARQFSREPVRLGRTLSESWRFAVLTSRSDRRVEDLLVPSLPPFLCTAGLTSDMRTRPALDRAIGQAESAAANGNRDRLQEAVETIENEIESLSGTEERVARYAVARALGAGGDWAGAANHLKDVEAEAGDLLPIVPAPQALRATRSRDAQRAVVILVFHSRYLAGVAARFRGRAVEAVEHFRHALNAVNYYMPSSRGFARGGHYNRIEILPEELSCPSSAQRSLTSLDAYAGLVAAYMAADSGELSRPDKLELAEEVARGNGEMNAGDPLARLLEHAQGRGLPSGSPIPENIVWAASNLQRVYHYNRLNPDPALAAGRTVLTLRVLDEPAWMEALDLDPKKQCGMLSQVVAGLRRDGPDLIVRQARPTRADSAWAAVAVHAFARLEAAQCPDVPDEPLSDEMKGGLLDLAGELVHAGLVARYDGWRRQLEDGLEAAAAADILDRARAHARAFCRGGIPPELNAGIDAEAACDFVPQWRRAVFHDVASHLVEEVRSGDASSRIRSRDASAYVQTLEAAVSHAGLRPSALYRAEDLAPLMRAPGSGRTELLRHHARNRPSATVAAVAVLTLAGLVLTVLLFVNWWRFVLVTRTDFYADELAERKRSLGPGGRPDL